MAHSDQPQLQQINQILEALSSCERLTLSYLCESSDTDSSVTPVREMLKSKVQGHENPHLFLEELMLRLGRFDILKKVYKVSREDVERSLRYRQVLPRYRVLMANISEDLVVEDLDGIKFLLSSTVSREKMENAKNFLHVVIELEKLDSLSSERVDLIEECLQNIGRLDLAKKVTAYKMSVQPCELHSSQQQSCRVSQISQGQSLQIARRSMPPLSVCREQSAESTLDHYRLTTNPRGVCVIIDCVGNDGEMLEETFKALHFSVVLYKWLSGGDIYSTLTGIFRQSENRGGDCFVCCIISRGTANDLLGTDLYGRGLPMDTVRHLFTADTCPLLAGKPKLFFIQRYSVRECLPHARVVHRDEDLETDGYEGLSPYNSIPTDADIFWSHSWTDEHQLEQEQHHSIYLKALTEALRKPQRRKSNLINLHTEVNGAIFEHNKRSPGANYHIDVKHTLRKNLYLE